MLEKVNKIKSIPFDVLKGSPDVMLLLSVYSTLFLRNSQPGTCERCMKQYYYEICTTGTERAIMYEKMIARKCKPAWTGIKYIRGAFYDSEMINDEQAASALKLGYLKEDDFKVLPESVITPAEPEKEEVLITKEAANKKGRKPKK